MLIKIARYNKLFTVPVSPYFKAINVYPNIQS